MARIKELKVREVVKVLVKYGFKFVRSGKHDVYYNEEKKITVPVPASHGIITRGVIHSIIRRTGIPRDEFF